MRKEDTILMIAEKRGEGKSQEWHWDFGTKRRGTSEKVR